MNRRRFIKITLPLTTMPWAPAAIAQNDETARQQPAITFGVIADPQYADAPPKGQRHYRNSIQKIKQAITELNRHPLDFVVTLGDIIDRDIKSFDAMMPLYKIFKAPQRFVLGNHDFDVADKDKTKVLGKVDMARPYHAESRKNWHFIYLDGNDVSTYRYPKKDKRTQQAEVLRQQMKKAKHPQAQPWNGAVGSQQLEWLAKELHQAQKRHQRVIIFNHFPTFPLHSGHNLWNDQEVVRLIEKFPNVAAYMNGHNHSGHYAVNKGCHYLNFKGMVETKDKTAYAIARCFPDKIEIKGYDLEPNRTLTK